MEKRIEEILDRVTVGAFMPLLSLPSHEGGWIAGSELVARLLQMKTAGHAPGKCDMIQALLRLAPDERAKALKELVAGPDEATRALRWALGGEATIIYETDDCDLWLAAGRARCPRSDLMALERFPSLRLHPDSVKAARYHWRVPTEAPDANVWRPVQILRDVEPVCKPKEKLVTRPTVLLHLESPAYSDIPAWVIEWHGMVWPHVRKAHFARGVFMMSGRTHSKASAWSPNYAYLHALYGEDTPVDETAALAILLGLCGMDQDACGVALDVLSGGIFDGRIVPETLRSPVSIIAPASWFKPSRLTANLSEVAQASPLHAWVVARTLEHLAVVCMSLPKDGHHIFTPLQELLTQLGLAVESATVAALGTLTGSGKSAKLAKKLLALEAKDNGSMAEVNRMMLESRIARAERWAGANLG